MSANEAEALSTVETFVSIYAILMCLPHQGDNLFILFYNLNCPGLTVVCRGTHSVYDERKM